ncbi:MAG TPA: hypothetical protein VHB46_05610 [Burkholderiales bacterium]|nr:hypothetical protein [Burkholderiales bacterium]
MKSIPCLFATAVFALPCIALAGPEEDLQVISEAIAEMVTAESMISTALDGECGKYAPEDFRLTRVAMRQKIEDLKNALSPDSKQRVDAQLASNEFKTELETFRKKGVDETLSMVQSKSGNQVFSCGYVFGFLSPSVLRFDHAMARAAKHLAR